MQQGQILPCCFDVQLGGVTEGDLSHGELCLNSQKWLKVGQLILGKVSGTA